MKNKWNDRPKWLIPALVTLALLFVYEVLLSIVPAGRWLANVRDTFWWHLLPWALIVLGWIYFIPKLRQMRGSATR